MTGQKPFERGVLDTSTLILLPRLPDTTNLPNEPLITAVTLAELSVGPLVASNDEERAARQAHLQQAESDFDPLPFDAAAARAFGRVAAALRRSGRKTTVRAYDAMIAATALAHGLPIFTCNPHDFQGIEGLEVVAVALPPPAPAPQALGTASRDSSRTKGSQRDARRRARRRTGRGS